MRKDFFNFYTIYEPKKDKSLKEYLELAPSTIEEFCYCVNLPTDWVKVGIHESCYGEMIEYACSVCYIRKYKDLDEMNERVKNNRISKLIDYEYDL